MRVAVSLRRGPLRRPAVLAGAALAAAVALAAGAAVGAGGGSDEVWMQPTGATLPAGKEWRHAFDPGSPETILPTTLPGYLADAEDVEEAGEDLVLGTRATRYRAELDVSSLAERDDAAERLETIAGGGDVRLPLEVWITPEGRPLLLRTAYQSAQRSIEVEVAYLEYGVDVEAEPPPNDVVEEDP